MAEVAITRTEGTSTRYRSWALMTLSGDPLTMPALCALRALYYWVLAALYWGLGTRGGLELGLPTDPCVKEVFPPILCRKLSLETHSHLFMAAWQLPLGLFHILDNPASVIECSVVGPHGGTGMHNKVHCLGLECTHSDCSKPPCHVTLARQRTTSSRNHCTTIWRSRKHTKQTA